MAQNPYAAAPMGMPMQNPEVGTIRTMLSVVRILALIGMVLTAIGAIGTIWALAVLTSAGYGAYGAVGASVYAIYIVVVFLFLLFVYLRIGAIRDLVDAGRLAEAKERTLIWMILGFIFGILVGVLLLIAYIKFDPAIRWQQQMQMGGQQPPAWGVPAAAPMVAQPFAPAAAPPPVASTPAAVMCPRCGRPATWIGQYSRWYCYNDQQYV